MINVIIVDDQKLVREGIKRILSSCEQINVIGEAENGRELLHLMKELSPDVVLTDIKIPMIDGIKITKLIKSTYRNVKVVILTNICKDEYIFRSIRYGADAYILKNPGSNYIIEVIKSVYNGAMFLDPKVTTRLVHAFNSSTNENTQNNYECDTLNQKLDLLTPREFDIASLVSRGKSNKDICNTLFLSEGTVKNYVTKILAKFELNSRTELALFLNDARAHSI